MTEHKRAVRDGMSNTGWGSSGEGNNNSNHEILSETYPLQQTTGSTLSFDEAVQNRVGETAMTHRPGNAP